MANRFNREYRGESFNLPPEVEGMPIFREWASGALSAKLSSPFWEIAQPRKRQTCLDLGCGVSFLIYPWRDWGALFYGQEISTVAQQSLTSRGPQLNSKLFKGVKLEPAHKLDYDANQFDLVIATGFSCYFPITYWQTVITAVKKVLKPTGVFVFDVLDIDKPLAENWAILETYLGAEVILESMERWKQLIRQSGGKVTGKYSGEVFHLFKVKW
ncbi:MAG: class I SAM-dependent methyltransferase [Leptolyngbyaceae cyanobacterium MO_188.B28]|nr:class I SAM-dependent methyltransferase [Leptolyngbyaceae cyanobacterium MO_188.B28]